MHTAEVRKPRNTRSATPHMAASRSSCPYHEKVDVGKGTLVLRARPGRHATIRTRVRSRLAERGACLVSGAVRRCNLQVDPWASLPALGHRPGTSLRTPVASPGPWPGTWLRDRRGPGGGDVRVSQPP